MLTPGRGRATICPMRYAIALVLIAACSSSDDGPCIEGTTDACTCASGASGSQTCLSTGTFSPCVCVSGNDATGPDAAGPDALVLDSDVETIECACQAPDEATVAGVLRLALTLGPDDPIAFDAAFAIDSDGVTLTLQARATDDGRLVGAQRVVAGTISGGVVDISIDDLVVPAAANSVVSNLEIRLDVRIHGCLGAARLAACGEADGAVTAPVQQSIDGSRWTLAEGELGSCACL